MLLASGKKGYRAALPHARIKTAPPRLNRAMGNASRVMVQANELEDVTETYKDFMCKFTGQPREVIEKDVGRDKYFTPEQAVDYGLIDRIVQPDSMMFDKQDYESMLASSGRGRPGAAAQPGMA
ncbi:unnamed protein product [Pedinophyceae sp. YPF-701]|nr:unnamed protein product [Pedinophyceae sp. YPF-701]